MASRPFQFLEKKRSKIRKRAAKHFEGLAALSTHSTGRRAAVKTGCKPVHFSLDGCPLSCYFPGVWPLLRDTLSTSRSVGRGTGAFIYLPPFSETSPIFCSFPFTKSQPVFLPEQAGRKQHRTPFPPSAGITHYTLQAKSCANKSFSASILPPFDIDGLTDSFRLERLGFNTPGHSSNGQGCGNATHASSYNLSYLPIIIDCI